MVEVKLEDIDELRRRTGVGYREAREVLEKCNGDLVEALVYMEENKENPLHKISLSARHVLGQLHQTRMKIKVKDRTMLELPVTVGAVGVALFPKLAALGLLGLLFSRGGLEIQRGGSAENGEGSPGEDFPGEDSLAEDSPPAAEYPEN